MSEKNETLNDEGVILVSAASLNALTRERDEAVRERDDLRAKLDAAEVKAAFAEEIRRKRNHPHTVYWWAEYLEEFDHRYDSLTTDKAAQETKDGEG